MSPARIPTRCVFTRIGRMMKYAGLVQGDKRPVDGGGYNRKETGYEYLNFKPYRGELYGYFETGGKLGGVNLARIDPKAEDESDLDDVLVVFVARRKTGGQAIVGWYDRAKVLARPKRRPPIDGDDQYSEYLCRAKAEFAVLLPQTERLDRIPHGKGAMGRSNVCYPYDENGRPKNADWMDVAIEYIRNYRGENLLTNPDADLLEAAALNAENGIASGQGRATLSSAEKKRLEKYAEAWAARYFCEEGYSVENVGATDSFDLLCVKGREKLLVEVKGTTSSGEQVILTRNEAELKGKRALFVVHSVQFVRGKPKGGDCKLLQPWRVERSRLSAINYVYRLPQV